MNMMKIEVSHILNIGKLFAIYDVVIFWRQIVEHCMQWYSSTKASGACFTKQLTITTKIWIDYKILQN
jgi:hypothetical protein